MLLEVLICMVVRFWYFPRHNVTLWREHALHFNVRLTQALQLMNFYGRNSHFLRFGNLSQSLMENNVKFVLNDVKATAFSDHADSKRRDIRASIPVPLASQSNVARNAA